MPKFASSLTKAQVSEAREFERAGLTTFSQAVKAFERGNTTQIDTWRRQIDESSALAEAVQQQRDSDPLGDYTTEDFDDALNRGSRS